MAEESEKKKETVKLLRKKKKPAKENLELQKDQKKITKAIKKALESGPKTIPQIAEESSLKPSTVVWYMFSIRQYGEVAVEGEAEEGYYSYKLVEESSEEGEAEESGAGGE